MHFVDLVASRVLPVMIAAALAGAGCAHSLSKEELEIAKNTYTCQANGERLVIRFDSDEARLLTADGERTVLYQIASGSGIRFSNGVMELRGKGTDLQLIRDGVSTTLANCKPIEIPK